MLAQQREQQDAGPDTTLHSLPTAVINNAAPDAGSSVAAAGSSSSGSTGGSSGSVGTTPEVVPPKELVWGAEGCPAGMAHIAAGTFKMGTSESDPLAGWDDKPLANVTTKAYCIDLYEYPNQESVVPKTSVAYKDADTACTEQGKRLCGEDEWERACKGPQNVRFAGGEAKACSLAKTPAASGTWPGCKSGYGVFDLSGNLAEWTSSTYNAQQGGKAIKGAPSEGPGRCSGRKRGNSNGKADNVGFRCCVDSKQP
jgi:formylglycine-generating enzyme required for sulfatase activity